MSIDLRTYDPALSQLGFGVYSGTGAPTFASSKGTLYVRLDGSSSSTRLYINIDGLTTWTSLTTAA